MGHLMQCCPSAVIHWFVFVTLVLGVKFLLCVERLDLRERLAQVNVTSLINTLDIDSSTANWYKSTYIKELNEQ